MSVKYWYRALASDDFGMIDHISKLQKLQEELHLMGSIVIDEDFVMILITSLPEAWDNYTSAYLGSSRNMPELRSHKIIAILLDEDQRHKERLGNSGEMALQAKGKRNENRGRKGLNREEKSNQAEEVNASLNDVAYMASGCISDSKHSWCLDSGTTSHICNNREAYTKFIKTDPVPIRGIGSSANSMRYGTIMIYFHVKGRTLLHELQNVLYLPDVPNCLILVSQFDEKGGRIIFHKGECFLEGKNKNIIGHGTMHGWLYLLEAAVNKSNEASLYVATPKLSWDQWHRQYGHIAPTVRGLYIGIVVHLYTPSPPSLVLVL